MTEVYRVKLFRWNFEQKNEYRNFALTHDIIGFGWAASNQQYCTSVEMYRANIEQQIKEGWVKDGASWRHTLAYLQQMRPGDFVWTLGGDGHYYCGKITDTEVHFSLPGFLSVGMWKKCQWKKYTHDQVPGKVITSLILGGTLQHVWDVTEYTAYLYDGTPFAKKPDFFALLHPDDLEDLLGLYLQQSAGYYVFPSTNKTGTALFEYMLVHKATGKRAVIQCKTGQAAVPPENIRTFTTDYKDMDVYITTLRDDDYAGANIHVIKKETLKTWAQQHLPILPGRIKNFLLISQ